MKYWLSLVPKGLTEKKDVDVLNINYNTGFGIVCGFMIGKEFPTKSEAYEALKEINLKLLSQEFTTGVFTNYELNKLILEGFKKLPSNKQ